MLNICNLIFVRKQAQINTSYNCPISVEKINAFSVYIKLKRTMKTLTGECSFLSERKSKEYYNSTITVRPLSRKWQHQTWERTLLLCYSVHLMTVNWHSNLFTSDRFAVAYCDQGNTHAEIQIECNTTCSDDHIHSIWWKQLACLPEVSNNDQELSVLLPQEHNSDLSIRTRAAWEMTHHVAWSRYICYSTWQDDYRIGYCHMWHKSDVAAWLMSHYQY